jgi:hypothetical protein
MGSIDDEKMLAKLAELKRRRAEAAKSDTAATPKLTATGAGARLREKPSADGGSEDVVGGAAGGGAAGGGQRGEMLRRLMANKQGGGGGAAGGGQRGEVLRRLMANKQGGMAGGGAGGGGQRGEVLRRLIAKKGGEGGGLGGAGLGGGKLGGGGSERGEMLRRLMANKQSTGGAKGGGEFLKRALARRGEAGGGGGVTGGITGGADKTDTDGSGLVRLLMRKIADEEKAALSPEDKQKARVKLENLIKELEGRLQNFGTAAAAATPEPAPVHEGEILPPVRDNNKPAGSKGSKRTDTADK